MKLKYLNSDYIPKGTIAGFPLEIVDKMLEKQVEQYNKANVEVFENSISTDMGGGGFTWSNTKEGHDFWKKIIKNEKFDVFFEKYPKEKELPLPRVIEVRNGEHQIWKKRVVILFRNNKALCWETAESVEDAENKWAAMLWEHWREVQEETKNEYKPFDFSNGVANYSHLLGRRMLSKNSESLVVINNLSFNKGVNKSFINGMDAKKSYEYYTFEDGTPVGAKI